MGIVSKLNKTIKEYNKETALTYLSILQLCKENSLFSGILANMTEFCVYKTQGETIPTMEEFIYPMNKIVNKYNQDLPFQEFLFVDSVHANGKTFKVFPGQYCNFQKDVSTLLNLIAENEIKCKDLNLALILLTISDSIASRLSLTRYELGCPDKRTLHVPISEELSLLKDSVVLKRKELNEILQAHHFTIDDFNHLVLDIDVPIRIDSPDNEFSIIERLPFMRLTTGEYLILQPSALLSSVFCLLLSVYYEGVKGSWFELYKNETLQKLLRTRALSNYQSIGRGEVDEQPSLIFRVDKDKILCIQTVMKPEALNSYKLYNKGVYSYLNTKYPDFKINVILAIDVLGQHGSCMNFGENEVIIMPFEDLEVILNTVDFDPLDLWYYIEDRKNLRVKIHGQELDSFAFYYNNQRTFYNNVSLNPKTIFTIVIGNALQLRYENAKVEDLHYLSVGNNRFLVERYCDISTNLPIYVPFRDSSKNTFIGEYSNGHLILSVRRNYFPDLTKEIAKSIVLWTYCIEFQTKTQLVSTNIVIELILYNGNSYKMKKRKVNSTDIFVYYIPLTDADNYTNEHLERNIILHLFQGLKKYKEGINPKYKSMISQTFKSCKGHILQGTNDPDILLNMDGETNLYYVCKRCCETLLDDIASVILRDYQKDNLLSVSESKATAITIQNYVENRLKESLRAVANKSFLIKLLKLHHAFQYWKALGRARYKGIDEFLSNIGEKYENQKLSAVSYSEGDNAACYIIELIIRNGYNTEESILPSFDDINMIFAYASLLYNIGMYLDVLYIRGEKARLRVLESGRFCFPLQEMDLFDRYFSKLREDGFDELSKFRKKVEELPQIDVDTKSPSFTKAFKEEYGFDYTTFHQVINRCLELSFAQDVAIYVMTEEKFVNSFFSSNNIDCYNSFKKHFIMSKEASTGLDYSEFYPHRHNRLFQMSTRPWVLYNNELMFSYKSLYISFSIFLERLSNGILRASSNEMKTYLGSVREKKGLMFNQQMYQLYSNLGISNLKVFQGVKIGKGEMLDNENSLGDIDLLLIDMITKKIVCIELKNYMESRSLWSVITQERETKDDLKIVIKRNNWCQNHIQNFKALINDNDDNKYDLKTVFITYNLQVHKYLNDEGTTDSQIVLMDVSQIIDAPLNIFNVF